MDPDVLRMIERIVIALGGVLSVYLGYRLFSQVPLHTNSEGKFEIEGYGGVTLLRVGPGVFFALFGAWILWFGLISPIGYRTHIDNVPYSMGLADVSGNERVASDVDPSNRDQTTEVQDKPTANGDDSLSVRRERRLPSINYGSIVPRIFQGSNTSPEVECECLSDGVYGRLRALGEETRVQAFQQGIYTDTPTDPDPPGEVEGSE